MSSLQVVNRLKLAAAERLEEQCIVLISELELTELEEEEQLVEDEQTCMGLIVQIGLIGLSLSS